MYDDYEFDGQESGASTIVGVLILSSLIIGGALGLIWYLQGGFVGRQFVTALLVPVGVLWLLLFFCAMVATFTKQKFLAVMLWLMLLGFSLAGNQSFSNSLIGGLEDSQANFVMADDAVYDYGFVLGGGLSVGRNNRLDFNAAGERVLDAVNYYKKGSIKHLVFTGSPFLYKDDEAKAKAADEQAAGNPPADAGMPPADAGGKFGEPNDPSDAEGKGVPSESLEMPNAINGFDGGPNSSGLPGNGPSLGSAWQDDLPPPRGEGVDPIAEDKRLDGGGASDNNGAEIISAYEESVRKLMKRMDVPESDYTFIGGRHTAEEMIRIDEFLADKDKSITAAVITSAWHMPRASRLAIRQGLTLVPVPVDFRTEMSTEDPVFFIPKIDNLETTSLAIKEYIGGWFQ